MMSNAEKTRAKLKQDIYWYRGKLDEADEVRAGIAKKLANLKEQLKQVNKALGG